MPGYCHRYTVPTQVTVRFVVSDFLFCFCDLRDFHLPTHTLSPPCSYTYTWSEDIKEHICIALINSQREQALGQHSTILVSFPVLPQNADRFSWSSPRGMRICGEIVSIVVLCMHTWFFIYILLNTVKVHFTFTTDSKNIEWGNLSLLLFISLVSKEAKAYSARSLSLCMYMRKTKCFSKNFWKPCLISARCDRRGEI